MELRMTAKHAQWPRENDPIFAIAGRAKEAQDKFGKDKVIDATIGHLCCDHGSVVLTAGDECRCRLVAQQVRASLVTQSEYFANPNAIINPYFNLVIIHVP